MLKCRRLNAFCENSTNFGCYGNEGGVWLSNYNNCNYNKRTLLIM